jgi:hypothetical protein
MAKVLAYVNEKLQEFAMDEMNSDERVRGGNGAMVDKHQSRGQSSRDGAADGTFSDVYGTLIKIHRAGLT